MKVLIIRSNKDEAILLSQQIADYLKDLGHECLILDTKQSDDYENPNDIGLEISIGGDGTVLCASRVLKGKQTPVLAINMGSFGYISQTSAEDAIASLGRFFKNELTTDRRMNLKASLYRNDELAWTSRALNEVVISCHARNKMIKLNLSIDDICAATIRSDGIIVATPTGSTAYSMSSGGPILDSSMDAMIINPICPFTLSNRPIVVKGSSIVKLDLSQKQSTSMMLCCDGQNPIQVLPQDRIIIEKGEGVNFLTTVNRSYLEVLRQKLKWSGDVNA